MLALPSNYAVRDVEYGRRTFSLTIDGNVYQAILPLRSLLSKRNCKKMKVLKDGMEIGNVLDMYRQTRKDGTYGTCVYAELNDKCCVSYIVQEDDNCAYEVSMMTQPFPWSYASGGRSEFTPEQVPIAHGHALRSFDGFEFDVEVSTSDAENRAMCILMMAYLDFIGFKRMNDYKTGKESMYRERIIQQEDLFFDSLHKQIVACRSLSNA